MRTIFLSLLLGVMVAHNATAQEQSTLSPEYEQVYNATIKCISQRLESAMAKLETGDSTALAEGDGYCTLMLGIAYYKGQGIKRDYDKAFGWFNLSVRQGESSANQALAECYYYGRGVERDYEQAKIWCQRGVEAEDPEAVKFMKKLKNK